MTHGTRVHGLKAADALTQVVLASGDLYGLGDTVLTVIHVRGTVTVLGTIVVPSGVTEGVLVMRVLAVEHLVIDVELVSNVNDDHDLAALDVGRTERDGVNGLVLLQTVRYGMAARRNASLTIASDLGLDLRTDGVLRNTTQQYVTAVRREVGGGLANKRVYTDALRGLGRILLIDVGTLVLRGARRIRNQVVLLPVYGRVLPLLELGRLTQTRAIVGALGLLGGSTANARVGITGLT